MDEADKRQYKRLFLKTGRAYLADIEKNFAAIHKNLHNENAFENLYIAVHSLRGQSLMMGYGNLGNYLDQVEKTLHARQRHLLEFDYKLFNAFESGVRKMKKMFTELEFNDSGEDFSKELLLLHNAAGTKIYI